MSAFRHFPLGETCPPSPHAVISSLPTMAAVRGYEEKDPDILSALQSGYPRFVVHPFVRQLLDFYLRREGIEGQTAVLIPGRRSADDLLGFLGQGYRKIEVEADHAIYMIVADDEPEGPRVKALQKMVQHIGCGLSSREAEDLLLRHGLRDTRFSEPVFVGHALSHVERELAALMNCRAVDVLVCASGMNAFYAGFRAVQECQRVRGRTVYLQLGWLYLDSGCVLKALIRGEESLECLYDVSDLEVILKRIAAAGDRLAAVVVECPSNPLVRVCDLPIIAEVVRAAGAVMMVDPTMASVLNVDVLPHCDLLVTSLTKYAAVEGDVMIGALAVNPQSAFYGDLIQRVSRFYTPPYKRDVARLALELESAPALLKVMDRNAAKLCEFLREHPAVKAVFCAGCSPNIETIQKPGSRGGVVITIELAGELERFYDAIAVMKGPSFGTRFTVLCPFMYLAHYDLVTSPDGRNFLNSVGIAPELVRISVGAELYEAIEAVFDEALKQSMI